MENFVKCRYDERYLIGDQGTIIGTTGRPIKPICNRERMLVHIYHNKKYTTYKIHRLVAEHFIPNPDNKPNVIHIDGNRKNNKATNLMFSNKRGCDKWKGEVL